MENFVVKGLRKGNFNVAKKTTLQVLVTVRL